MTFEVLAPKDPNVNTEYALDARRLAYREMRRDWPYGAGAIVKAPRHTGFYYECTTPGETKHYWPDLPRAAGQTVADGSVVWTARAPSAVSLPTISAVAWTINPAGALTVASHSIDGGGIVKPMFAGGAAGSSYDVTARITWSTGQQEDFSVTVPVAEQ